MVMDDIKSQICCKVTKTSQALSPVKLQKIKNTGKEFKFYKYFRVYLLLLNK